MNCLGDGEVPQTAFDDDFFTWWDQQIIVVDDYSDVGLDF